MPHQQRQRRWTTRPARPAHYSTTECVPSHTRAPVPHTGEGPTRCNPIAPCGSWKHHPRAPWAALRLAWPRTPHRRLALLPPHLPARLPRPWKCSTPRPNSALKTPNTSLTVASLPPASPPGPRLHHLPPLRWPLPLRRWQPPPLALSGRVESMQYPLRPWYPGTTLPRAPDALTRTHTRLFHCDRLGW